MSRRRFPPSSSPRPTLLRHERRRRGSRWAALAVLVGALLSPAAPVRAAAGQSLPAVDLAPAWAGPSEAVAVNDLGQTVVSNSADGTYYLRTGAQLVPLTYQGKPIQVFALNNRGQVAGAVQVDADRTVAVLWEHGGARALAVPGDLSMATDINDRGQTAVISVFLTTQPASTRAYLVDGDGARDLGAEPFLVTPSLLINNAGQVAGNEVRAGGPVFGSPTAFIWENGHTRHLPTLGGPGATVADLNERGEMVGLSDLPNGDRHGVTWTGGVITDLGTLGGRSSDAVAVNDRGQVAGAAETATGIQEAVTWFPGRAATSLGIGGSRPVDVDERGQVVVVASGSSAEAPSRGYVWHQGVATELGTLGGPVAVPEHVNRPGLIVGEAQLPSGTPHAAAWNTAGPRP